MKRYAVIKCETTRRFAVHERPVAYEEHGYVALIADYITDYVHYENKNMLVLCNGAEQKRTSCCTKTPAAVTKQIMSCFGRWS